MFEKRVGLFYHFFPKKPSITRLLPFITDNSTKFVIFPSIVRQKKRNSNGILSSHKYLWTRERGITFMTIFAEERKRKDLFLPILYFPVADPTLEGNWIDTLGEKAFCIWLKLNTLANRKADSQYTKVPVPMEDIAKQLNVSKSTLYRVIRPLWNYGLINLEEFKGEPSKMQNPVNIIVYPYPLNDKQRENQPLVKLRDYDEDYKSDGKTYGKLGGRPKTEKPKKKYRLKRSTNETAVKSTVSQIEHNNKQKDKDIKNNNNKRQQQSQNLPEVKKPLSQNGRFDDSDMQNAIYLLHKMKANAPIVITPNMDSWANEFRILREKLQLSDKTIRYMIDYCQSHDFWKSNIRSAKTFRTKYDRLFIQAKTDYEKAQRPAYQRPDEIDFDELKQKYRQEETKDGEIVKPPSNKMLEIIGRKKK